MQQSLVSSLLRICRNWREDDSVHIIEVVLNGVSALAVCNLCLAHIVKNTVIHQFPYGSLVDTAHYIQFVLLGLLKDLIFKQPLRSCKEVFLKEIQGLLLLCLWNKRADIARLV